MQTFSLFYVKETQGFVLRDRMRRASVGSKQIWAECFFAIMSLCGRGGIISQTSLTWRNLTTCKWGLKRIKASSGCMTHFCVYHLLHHGSRGHRFLRIGSDQVSPASCDHIYTGTFVVLCFATAIRKSTHALTSESSPGWHDIPFPWSCCICLTDEQPVWVMDRQEGRQTDGHAVQKLSRSSCVHCVDLFLIGAPLAAQPAAVLVKHL